MEPYLLLIETSAKTCSVALSKGNVLVALAEDYGGEHTQVINSLIREVLNQSGITLKDLDAIAVNEGPGSFTSLRIGVVAAKGLAYGLDKPLILISGLLALAEVSKELIPEADYYIPMLDARRDEVYLSVFNNSLKEIQEPSAQILNDEMKSRLNIGEGICVITGSGTPKWAHFITNWPVLIAEFRFSASNLAKLAFERWEQGTFSIIDEAKPFYLKEPNITIPKEKLISR